MKRIIGIILFGLIAMFFLAVDIIFWVNFTPNDIIQISLGIVFGVVGLLAAYLSVSLYKKEVQNASN
jgi:hypothetical protein